jgi:FkbM family methyltransferase
MNVPKFDAFNAGLGARNAELEIYDYNDRDGSAHASLYLDVIKELHKGKPIAHSVKIIRLDDFVEENNIGQIDLLKIDTEGNELDVLMGATGTLKKNKVKAIHFEFNEMNVISAVNFKMFWDLLDSYNFYRLLPGGKLLHIKDYCPITCEIYAYQNIVCLLK